MTIEDGKAVFMETYAQYPLILSGGEGCRVVDDRGRSYLDLVSGIAVNALGYKDPELIQALQGVLDGGLLHCSNLYWNNPAIEAARALVELSGMDRVFFCNSGTEANEAAIKLARKYGSQKDQRRTDIIAMEQSFHGRTYGSLSATGQEKYQKAFRPLVPGFFYTPFNNLEGVEALVSDTTCAILVEPVQGEGGVIPAKKEFLTALRSLCDRNDILLIFDEVQCGMGRTGHAFAWQGYGVQPDVMTLGKALGCGVPIGAMVARNRAATTFVPGDHAATFGGNLLSTSAATVILNRLTEGTLLKHVQQVSQHLLRKLEKVKKQFSQIIEIRGMGLMLGMELTVPARPIVEACMKRGMLITNAGVKVLRFVPPLVITEKEIDEAVAILQEALQETL